MQEIQEILSQQKQYLAHYFANLPLEQLKKSSNNVAKYQGYWSLQGLEKVELLLKKLQ